MSFQNGPFRRILLAFNPAAGPRRRGLRDFKKVRQFLFAANVEVRNVTLGSEQIPTDHNLDNFDAIFVCGGDGTVNQVLLTLMSAGREIPIGVIPIGSGNLFAGSLGTPHDAIAAAQALLDGESRRMGLGTITQSGATSGLRYWTAAAGIGADARVICDVKPQWKARLGVGAYYAESVRQLCSPSLRLPWFQAEFKDQSGAQRCELVTQVIAERMAYFGHAASRKPEQLKDDEMRIVLIKSAKRLPYLRFGAALLASQLNVCGYAGIAIEVAIVKEIACAPLARGERQLPVDVLAEVDGELIGVAPVRLGVQPRAASVIIPRKQERV